MLTARFRLDAVLVCGLLAIAACGSVATTAIPTHSPRPSPTPAPTPTPTPTPVPLAAPLMIQVENLSAARPQSGLNQAEVVYEYQTEGGISRFSAFYFHLPSGQVGPVPMHGAVELHGASHRHLVA